MKETGTRKNDTLKYTLLELILSEHTAKRKILLLGEGDTATRLGSSQGTNSGIGRLSKLAGVILFVGCETQHEDVRERTRVIKFLSY